MRRIVSLGPFIIAHTCRRVKTRGAAEVTLSLPNRSRKDSSFRAVLCRCGFPKQSKAVYVPKIRIIPFRELSYTRGILRTRIIARNANHLYHFFPMSENRPSGSAAHNHKRTWLLTLLIFAGLALGAGFGQWLYGFRDDPDPAFYNAWIEGLNFIGSDIFLGLLKMMIVPLIISSVIVGIASIGDFRKLGRIGVKTIAYYVATMAAAAAIGLVLVNTIRPGEGMDRAEIARGEEQFAADDALHQKIEQAPQGFGPAMLKVVRDMIPTNPVAAAADPRLMALPIIFFSIFFAVVLTTIGRKKDVVVSFFDAVFEVMTKMVHAVILLAPVGVFALVAWSIARIGLQAYAGGMLWYVLTVLLGLAVHGILVLPATLKILGRTHPYVFMRQMRRALLTAFGTDSSSATLPVTIDAAIEEGGCSKKAAGFVLPLGATINMDGTALFEAVAVVFIAQAYGVQLGIAENLIIVLTAVLTAVGVAGIPSGSIVMIPIIIGAVNQSLGGSGAIPAEGIGLILGIDRLLDMSRTTVNVWGDAVGAKIISRTETDEEEVAGVVSG